MKILLFLIVLAMSGCHKDNDCAVGSGFAGTNPSMPSTIVTPEPASFWLLLVGLIVMGVYLYVRPSKGSL